MNAPCLLLRASDTCGHAGLPPLAAPAPAPAPAPAQSVTKSKHHLVTQAASPSSDMAKLSVTVEPMPKVQIKPIAVSLLAADAPGITTEQSSPKPKPKPKPNNPNPNP